MNRIWMVRIFGIVVLVLLLAMLFSLQSRLATIATQRSHGSSAP